MWWTLENKIYLWDDANGQFVQLLEGDKKSDFYMMAVSKNNRVVAAEDESKCVEGKECIRIWDVETGKLIQLIPMKKVGRIQLSPDGRYLVTEYYGERHVTLWDVSSGKVKYVLENPKQESGSHAFAFSPDGKILAVSFYNRIVLWEVESGKLLRHFKVTDIIR